MSQVIYRKLGTNQQLWLEVSVKTNFLLYVQTGIPVIKWNNKYRPTTVVVGPGLASPGVDLPFKLPKGQGAVVMTTTNSRSRFFREHFTGTDSWILLEKTIALDEPGTYFIVASAPPDEADKLWVAVGYREVFGLGDIFFLASVIQGVRTFHEIRPEIPARTDWPAVTALALIGSIWLLAVWRGLG